MKDVPLLVLLSLTFQLGCGLNLFAADPSLNLAGHWEGAIVGGLTPRDIEVDFARQADGSWQGTITIPEMQMEKCELSRVALAGSNVMFDLSANAGSYRFVGTLTGQGKTISGVYTCSLGDYTSFPFKLERGITRDPEAIARKLASAAATGDIETLKKLLTRGADINGRSPEGLTPLFIARMEGQQEAYDFLLQKGADARAPEPAPEALVDGLFARLFPPDGPGSAVLVARNGKILFEKGYGLADVKQKTPITRATKFCLGPFTNQFTAAAILRLQEAGKLKITDPLSKYYPDFPGGGEVTLQHLLTQTSGIHNFSAISNFTHARLMTPAALIASIEKFPYDFKPGASWRYSMSNYFILSDIVEKASEQHYGDFLQKMFFTPLGMNGTAVLYHNTPSAEANAGLFFDLLGVTSTYASHDVPPPNVALGYMYQNGRYKPRRWDDMSWVGEASSLYSTVEDLYRWNEGVFSHKALSHESLTAALNPVITEQNKPVKQDFGDGFAYRIWQLRGTRVVDYSGNRGGRDGFAAELAYLPDKNFTVVVLTNAYPQKDATDTETLSQKIMELYLGPELSAQPPQPCKASVPASALAAIAGRYDRGEAVDIISREGNRVYAQYGVEWRCEIFPESETAFFFWTGNETVTFVKDARGKVIAAVFRYLNGRAVYAPRLPDVAEIELDDAHSAPILGQYTDGTDTIWTISRKGGHLYMSGHIPMLGNPKYELGAISETELFAKEANKEITFVKDARGNVTSAVVHDDGGTRIWQKVKPTAP